MDDYQWINQWVSQIPVFLGGIRQKVMLSDQHSNFSWVPFCDMCAGTIILWLLLLTGHGNHFGGKWCCSKVCPVFICIYQVFLFCKCNNIIFLGCQMLTNLPARCPQFHHLGLVLAYQACYSKFPFIAHKVQFLGFSFWSIAFCVKCCPLVIWHFVIVKIIAGDSEISSYPPWFV